MSEDQPTNQDRVAGFVRSGVKMITARLQAVPNLSAEEADELARDCMHDITAAHGGNWLYVPKDLAYDLTKRDEQIFDDFNGHNIHVLVEKYKLTHIRLYQIIARVRKARTAKLQPQLPGLGDQP